MTNPTAEDSLANLYPKWNCPQCGDWFHMPYKFCQCSNPAAELFYRLRKSWWRRVIDRWLL